MEASNGKTLPALMVFAESLRYMKEHALNTVQEASFHTVCDPQEITWVITVPAIWSAAARQFMRLASKEVKQVVIPLPQVIFSYFFTHQGRGNVLFLKNLHFKFLSIREMNLPWYVCRGMSWAGSNRCSAPSPATVWKWAHRDQWFKKHYSRVDENSLTSRWCSCSSDLATFPELTLLLWF